MDIRLLLNPAADADAPAAAPNGAVVAEPKRKHAPAAPAAAGVPPPASPRRHFDPFANSHGFQQPAYFGASPMGYHQAAPPPPPPPMFTGQYTFPAYSIVPSTSLAADGSATSRSSPDRAVKAGSAAAAPVGTLSKRRRVVPQPDAAVPATATAATFADHTHAPHPAASAAVSVMDISAKSSPLIKSEGFASGDRITNNDDDEASGSLEYEGFTLASHPGLRPGMKVEAIKPRTDGTWYAARVIQLDHFPRFYLARKGEENSLITSEQRDQEVSMVFVHFEGFPAIEDEWLAPTMVRMLESELDDDKDSRRNTQTNSFIRYGARGAEIDAGWEQFAKFHRERKRKSKSENRTGVVWAGLGHGCPCAQTRKPEPVKASVGIHPERPERLRLIIAEWHRRGLLRFVHYVPRRMALRAEIAASHGEVHLRNYFAKPTSKDVDSQLSASDVQAKPPLANANSTSVTAGEAAPHDPIMRRGSITGPDGVMVPVSHDDEAKDAEAMWPPTLTSKLPCGKMGTAVDTIFDPDRSPDECRMSVGSLLNMVDSVLTGKFKNGFAAIRPPGHHAEPDQAMGFCIYNNVALASEWALAQHSDKVQRILIIDWDVHHGNGTEACFYDREDVLYISLHRYDNGDFYPFTGDLDRCGEGPGLGRNINIGWSKAKDRNDRMGDTEYLAALHHVVIPIAQEFQPDLVFISAGFDLVEGHMDGLGGYRVTPQGLSMMTQLVANLNGGKVIMVLEGGYELSPLTNAAAACLQELVACSSGDVPATEFKYALPSIRPNISAQQSLMEVIMTQRQHWQCMARLAMDVSTFGPATLNLPAQWRMSKDGSAAAFFTNAAAAKSASKERRRRRLSIEGY